MDFISAISKGSPIVIVSVILIFVLKGLFDSNAKEREKDRESHKQDAEKYQLLVNKVQDESKIREEKLMNQIDKCTTSLQENTESLKEISENIQVIPTMQEELKVIPTMQADISYLKEKVK